MGDKSWIYGYDIETSNDRHSGRAHSHQEKKGAAGPEFNKEHAHCFFQHEGNCLP
jgi:hypothetical protein